MISASLQKERKNIKDAVLGAVKSVGCEELKCYVADVVGILGMSSMTVPSLRVSGSASIQPRSVSWNRRILMRRQKTHRLKQENR